MNHPGELLLDIVETAEFRLRSISDSEASVSPGVGKWSKKQILGHLIDSACNNQQKFIRTIQSDQATFVRYQQDEWVQIQQYEQCPWNSLIDLWIAYNRHLAHVMKITPANCLNNRLILGDLGAFTLEFIMQDYVEHLKHHLNQILTPSTNP